MRALALLILIPILINAQGAGKQATRVKLIRSPKAVALAKAFHTGKLPDPLRMPRLRPADRNTRKTRA